MVREWHEDEGWGVLDSDATPGGCWAHFSSLDMDGYRSLKTAQVVEFTVETPGQDGFDFRATEVRAEGVPPALPEDASTGAAYSSTLTVTFDEPDP